MGVNHPTGPTGALPTAHEPGSLAVLRAVVRRPAHGDLRCQVMVRGEDTLADVAHLAARLMRRLYFMDPMTEPSEIHWRVLPWPTIVLRCPHGMTLGRDTCVLCAMP